MKAVALVLVLAIAAAMLPVPAHARPEDTSIGYNEEVVEPHNWSALKTLLAKTAWVVLLFFGQNVLWVLYGDQIVEGTRLLVSLSKEKWERYIATIFVKTGRICRLARAEDGEWVALCED